MKNNNNIEDRMKSVSDLQRETPPAFVWSNIEKALQKKNKRKGFIFWLLLGIGISIVAAGFWGSGAVSGPFTVNASSSATINDSGSDQESELSNSALIENRSAEDDYSSNPSQIDPQDDSILEINPVSNTKINTNTSSSLSARSTIQSSSQNLDKSFVRNYDSNSLISREKESGASAKLIGDKTVKTPLQISPDQANVLKILTNDTPSDRENITHSPSLQSDGSTADSPLFIPLIQTLSIDLNTDQPILENKKVVCPEFSPSRKLDFFVEANLLAGTHSKKFGPTPLIALAANRSQTESPFIGTGLAVNAGLFLNRNFYLITGVEWYRATEKFSLKREGLTKVIIDYDIETNQPIDTSFVTGVLSNRGLIQYKMIDIPLSFGYRKQIGHWNYNFELGGQLNLAFSTEGKIATATNEVAYITKEAPVYRDKLGVAIKSSIGIGRTIRHGLSLQSRIAYKQYFNQVNHENYTLPTTLHFARVEIGLRKDF